MLVLYSNRLLKNHLNVIQQGLNRLISNLCIIINVYVFLTFSNLLRLLRLIIRIQLIHNLIYLSLIRIFVLGSIESYK